MSFPHSLAPYVLAFMKYPALGWVSGGTLCNPSHCISSQGTISNIPNVFLFVASKKPYTLPASLTISPTPSLIQGREWLPTSVTAFEPTCPPAPTCFCLISFRPFLISFHFRVCGGLFLPAHLVYVVEEGKVRRQPKEATSGFLSCFKK